MRETELLYYADAFQNIKRLEKESSDVREYLMNIRFLKTLDSQNIPALKNILDEKSIAEICEICESNSNAIQKEAKMEEKNNQRKIKLSAKIIEEFEQIINNGETSIVLNANLWDYLLEEVWIELKYSVARISDLNGNTLCAISGRPNFVEHIANLTELEIPKKGKKGEKRSEESFFNGKPKRIVELYLAFKESCMKKADISVRGTKAYIAFSGRKNIASIVIQRSQIRIYLMLHADLFNDPQGVIYDISNIPSFCNAPSEIILKNFEEVEYFSNIIAQGYELSK